MKSKPVCNETVVELLSRELFMSSKFQYDIAKRIGYDKPNIITLFKKGMG